MLTGTIPANGFYIVARTASSFTSCFGFAPDQELGPDGPADSNGDDQIQLLDPSQNVLDIFGVPGEDGTGTCHEFEDGRAERIESVTTGNGGTWNEANWNVWADSYVAGCTNHIHQAVNIGDGIFDPGQWIGYVPTTTIVNFESITSTVAENGGSIDVCVEITNPDPSNATTVEIDFDPTSTAINGADFTYISFPHTITFPAGSSTDQCLTITILDDFNPELDETIILFLQNPAGGNSAALGTINQHTVFIDDDDITCPNVGDLIISEIMQNPDAVADEFGEWFEIYNTTGSDIDMFGFEIIDDSYPTEGFAITYSLIIPAEGYLVFAANGNTAINGGLTPDYEYGYENLTLGNGLDGLTIQCSGTTMDTVIWDGGTAFPDPSGASMSLSVDHLNAIDNDDGANWEEAVFPYGDGDLGTPGCANDAPCCELLLGNNEVSCDSITSGIDTYTATIDFTGGGTSTYEITTTSGTIEGDDPSTVTSGSINITGINEGIDITITIDNSAVGGSCNLELNIESPVCVTADCGDAGSVIFSEIMQNPDAVADEYGEWFELYNTTDSDIDLQGWSIIDDNHTLEEEGFIIPVSLIISPDDYLVFANNGEITTNGGIIPDYVYDYDDLTLGNGLDGLTINCNDSIIDIVVWDDGITFPDPTGASMSLLVDHLNAIDNDDGVNWETAVFPYGDGDLGTPGCSNDAACCDLIIGDKEVSCDTITPGVDTYSAFIEFTGGGTSEYTITTTSGTIEGDDPTFTSSGTIIITGISEGTDITVTIDNLAIGGACNFVVEIISPVCFEPDCEDVGSIIFSEIMQNPDAVPDEMGEWFELYNTTDTDIDLHGWDIIDDNHTLEEEGFTFPNSLIIPAGEYLLIANNGDEATNGGLPTPDYVYEPGFPFLGNGTDGITIQCSGLVIDEVIWDDGATFPDPTGASMSLMMDYLNSIDNDDGTNWETVTHTYGDGDFGTPGNPNNEPVLIFENEIEELTIYPNPLIDGKLTIYTSSSSIKQIELYNIVGKKVFSAVISGARNEINLGKLNEGVYLIKVTENDKTVMQKLVVK